MPEMSGGRQSRRGWRAMLTTARSGSREAARTMIEARGSQAGLITPQARLRQRWHWQAVLAALLALLAVEGQHVAASYATFNPAGRMIQVSRGIAATGSSADASTSAGAVHETAAPSPGARPDCQVGFARLDDAQAGRPFSYALQVQNDGKAGGA